MCLVQYWCSTGADWCSKVAVLSSIRLTDLQLKGSMSYHLQMGVRAYVLDVFDMVLVLASLLE